VSGRSGEATTSSSSSRSAADGHLRPNRADSGRLTAMAPAVAHGVAPIEAVERVNSAVTSVGSSTLDRWRPGRTSGTTRSPPVTGDRAAIPSAPGQLDLAERDEMGGEPDSDDIRRHRRQRQPAEPSSEADHRPVTASAPSSKEADNVGPRHRHRVLRHEREEHPQVVDDGERRARLQPRRDQLKMAIRVPRRPRLLDRDRK
jgi:hypothetical protein